MFKKKAKIRELEIEFKKSMGKAHTFKIFETLGSTNTYLKNLPKKRGGEICLALTQTCGRGRGDKPFYSFGDGLYMSLLYRPSFEITSDISVRFTCSAAVAVCESIRSVTGLDAEIKWVNDIYIADKKVCGILTELVREGNEIFVIVGIGVNLISSEIPSDIGQIASALYAFGDKNIPEKLRLTLASEIIRRFDKLYEEIPTGGKLIDSYRDMSLIEGREIEIIRPDGTYSAKAKRICEDFSLEAEYENGTTERLSSGEVSLKLK